MKFFDIEFSKIDELLTKTPELLNDERLDNFKEIKKYKEEFIERWKQANGRADMTETFLLENEHSTTKHFLEFENFTLTFEESGCFHGSLDIIDESMAIDIATRFKEFHKLVNDKYVKIAKEDLLKEINDIEEAFAWFLMSKSNQMLGL
jgi:hypothetical protein